MLSQKRSQRKKYSRNKRYIDANKQWDKNEKYIMRKCINYLQRHLNRYPILDEETIEFLCWTLGDVREKLGEYIFYCLNEKLQDLFKSRLTESGISYTGYSNIIGEMLERVSPHTIKDIMGKIIDILKERYDFFNYSGSSETEKTISRIKKLFNLTDNEIKLCTFLFIIESIEPAENYFAHHLDCKTYMGRRYLCNALDISKNDLIEIFSSTLVTTELIENISFMGVSLSSDFEDLFHNFSTRDLIKKYYSKVAKTELPLSRHFVPVEQTEHILSLLVKKSNTSSHILFYGAPGTGKTSYAHGLVKKLGLPSYEIAQNSENTSKGRRAAITITLNITNRGNGSILIVDEADNILNTQYSWFMRGETQDKGYLNHLMEKPGVRIIWICNNIDSIEGSVLRRFAFSLHFKQFNRQQRISLFENIIRQNRVKRFFSFEDIDTLARRYDINAGSIDLSIKKTLE